MRRIITLLIVVFFNITLYSQNYKGLMGFGFSPKGQPYNFSQTGAFLSEVSGMCNGDIVYANTSWRDTITKSGQLPSLQKTICNLQPSPYGYVDMINFGWATYPKLYLNSVTDTTNNWTNSSTKALFMQTLIRAADSLKPTYLFIGNEVDFYWTQDSLDYPNWVTFYNQAYDSIKKHSPSTKVGTVFNFEHLTGNGALTGWGKPYWNAFNSFDTSKMDILGLTVYPFFDYDSANAVPLTYLDTIFARMGNKPIAITETGWPADSFAGKWISSPQQQVDYVDKLFTMIKGKNAEAVNWLYLYYLMDTTKNQGALIFKSVTMYDSLGNARPALAKWQSECSVSGIQQATALQDEIEVYPNPSQGKLYVRLSTGNAGNMAVYDIMGRCVNKYPLVNGTNQVQLNLASGLYFYHISAGGTIVKQGKLSIQDNQ